MEHGAPEPPLRADFAGGEGDQRAGANPGLCNLVHLHRLAAPSVAARSRRDGAMTGSTAIIVCAPQNVSRCRGSPWAGPCSASRATGLEADEKHGDLAFDGLLQLLLQLAETLVEGEMVGVRDPLQGPALIDHVQQERPLVAYLVAELLKDLQEVGHVGFVGHARTSHS